MRAPSARNMPNNVPPVPTQLNRRQTIYRPQAVPVALSDDPVSKERREAALRARGLLPSRQRRDLSAIEAAADRRIDALRNFDSPSPGSDNSHSDANEIAQTWRIRNSQWLYTPPNSDGPVDPMTQGPYIAYQRSFLLILYTQTQTLRHLTRQATRRDHRSHRQRALILLLQLYSMVPRQSQNPYCLVPSHFHLRPIPLGGPSVTETLHCHGLLRLVQQAQRDRRYPHPF